MSERHRPFTIRQARPDDLSALEPLIALSARGLGKSDYTDAQIEAALGGAWGVDTELIWDETHFRAEECAGPRMGRADKPPA